MDCLEEGRRLPVNVLPARNIEAQEHSRVGHDTDKQQDQHADNESLFHISPLGIQGL